MYIVIIFALCLIQNIATLPDLQHVHFQRMGEMTTDTTAYILIGEFDIELIKAHRSDIEDIRKWLRRIYERVPMEHQQQRKLIREQLKIIAMELKNIEDRTLDLDTLMASQKRVKRSILLMAGIAAVGGLLGNLWFTHSLNNRISELEDNQGHLYHFTQVAAHHISENAAKIAQLNDTLQAVVRHEIKAEHILSNKTRELEYTQRTLMVIDASYRSVTSLQDSIMKLLRVWDDAIGGKVTIDMMSPTAVKEELKRIKDGLPKTLTLAIGQDNLMDFYSLSCHPSVFKGKLRITIPIPVYNPGDVMDLLHYMPLPFPISKDLELISQGLNPVLAVNNERTLYREISIEDLSSCVKINQLHLCPQLRVLRKAVEPSCLFLLLQGKVIEAQKHCHQLVRNNSPLEVLQTSTTEFIAYARRDTHAVQICEETNTRVTVPIPPGMNIISLQNGCALSSDTIYVAPSRNATLDIDEWTVSIPIPEPLNLTNIFSDKFDIKMDDLDNHELIDLAQDLLKTQRYVTLPDLAKARLRIHPTHYVSSIALTLTLLLILTLACLIGYLYFRYKRKSRNTGVVRYQAARTVPNEEESSIVRGQVIEDDQS